MPSVPDSIYCVSQTNISFAASKKRAFVSAFSVMVCPTLFTLSFHFSIIPFTLFLIAIT